MAVDILNTYPWITEDFIFDKVQKCESNDVTIKSFNVECAVGKGENYCSNMIRITVNYFVDSLKTEKRASFILKAAIPNEEIDVVSNELQFFPKEIKAYNILIPQVESLLRSIGDYTQLAPKCYTVGENSDYLLFEDLTARGYSNVEKRLGLDFDHLKLVLTKVAKWHASTAFLAAKDPNIPNEYLKQNVRPELPQMGMILHNCVKALSYASNKWKGFEKIREKLVILEKNTFEKASIDILRDETGFKVITHGDLWSNNIMYKYDENKHVSDVLLVDFALGTWTAPGKDLSYFLFSSCKDEIRENEWNELLKLYHLELSSTLKKLNYPKRIPTLDDIHVCLDKSFMYDGIFGLAITALRQITRAAEGDGFLVFISEDEVNETYRNEMFSSPECEERLKFLLNYYDKKGFFELWK